MVGVLAKNYCACKDSLGTKLGELMNLIDNIKVGNAESKSQDVLKRIYECSLVNSQMPRESEVVSSLPNEIFSAFSLK